MKNLLTALSVVAVTGCSDMAQAELATQSVAVLQQPWAVAVLPQGGFLVTEKAGALRLITPDGRVEGIAGVPDVDASGQVGLHDVALAPDFAQSGEVYLTWVAGDNGGALHLGRGKLDVAGLSLTGFETLWRAQPSGGNGHPGGIIAFSPDGHLFLTTGERQLGDPAQNLADSRGKVLRLTRDGIAASGNPFPDAPEVWSYGHRNAYGMVFDASGALWSHEMGPRGGDEFNSIVVGENYGWPVVSDGTQYNGMAIPDHVTRPEFKAPLLEWTPVIAPAGMIYYTGDVFADWQGSFLIGGVASQALVQVAVDGDTAREVARWNMGARIRDVVADAQGNIYVLEDGTDAQLLRLTQ